MTLKGTPCCPGPGPASGGATRYSADLAWSDEDGGYIGLIPELPGVSAYGETRSEVVKELEIAESLILDGYTEHGIPLPEPRTRAKPWPGPANPSGKPMSDDEVRQVMERHIPGAVYLLERVCCCERSESAHPTEDCNRFIENSYSFGQTQAAWPLCRALAEAFADAKAMADRLKEVEAEGDALRAMLRKHEWVGLPHLTPFCPCCGKLQTVGHAPDCELAALLKEGGDEPEHERD